MLLTIACMSTTPVPLRDPPPPVVWRLAVTARGEVLLNGRGVTDADRASLGRRQRPAEASVQGAADARCDDVLQAIDFVRTTGAQRVALLSPEGRVVSRVVDYPAGGGAPLDVDVSSDGSLQLDGTPTDDTGVVATARERLAAGRPANVRLLVHESAAYGRVSALAEALRDAGSAWIGVTVRRAGVRPRLPEQQRLAHASSARITVPGGALEGFWPEEALSEGISARVRLSVTVESDGRISAATARNDPGFGLARAAERVLLSPHATATPARDADGRPVRSVITFTINFEQSAEPPQ